MIIDMTSPLRLRDGANPTSGNAIARDGLRIVQLNTEEFSARVIPDGTNHPFWVDIDDLEHQPKEDC